MNTHETLSELSRAMRDIIRIGVVAEVDTELALCRVSGIQTADVSATKSIQATAPNVMVTASGKITLDTPEVVCTNKLTTGSLEVKKGGAMKGNIAHSGGAFTSNGVQVDTHTHGGVQTGGGNTGKPN